MTTPAAPAAVLPPRLALLDYDAGNLRSVARALETTGARVEITTAPDALGGFDAVVLPGQGHFGDCAGKLAARGLWEPVKRWIAAGRPFLGICVGYQLLFEGSEEAPGTPGLGVFRGRVVRFPADVPGLKIPQIGWNSLRLLQPDAPLLRGLRDGEHFYFAHSYFPEPADPGLVAAECDYGRPFAAALHRDHVSAVQFHPEKSQRAGLRLLGNFVSGLTARRGG